MAYGLRYYFEFTDDIYEAPANWRVEWELKDHVGAVDMFPLMDDTPVVIERATEDENKLSAIVGTKMTLSCIYDGVSVVPHPRTFKNIQEDTYRITLYKNEVLYFRGFVKPDATSYPFADGPYPYQINATDYFNGMKSKSIDLNVDGKFYYGQIPLAGVLARTLFTAADYEDVAVRVLFRLRPDSMPGGSIPNILTHVSVHSDSFFTLEDGPLSIYDALRQLLQSLRARIFFSAGTYWLQRIGDIIEPYTEVLQFTNPGTTERVTVPKTTSFYGTDFLILQDSGEINVTPAIYKQTANYHLKAINQIANFTWANVTGDVLDDWFTNPEANTERVGAGTADENYRMRIFETGSASPITFSQPIVLTMFPGQRVQFEMKVEARYAKSIAAAVIVDNAAGASVGVLGLDMNGAWGPPDGSESGTFGSYFKLNVDISEKDNTGSINITSQALPNLYSEYNVGVYIGRIHPVTDPVPPEAPYIDVYPVFLRIFQVTITDVETAATNSKVFSLIPEKEDLFYLDANDDYLSNTLFVNNGTDILPIPKDNWRDEDTNDVKSLDWYAGRTIIDNFNECSNAVSGQIRSNTLEFYQSIYIGPIDDGVKLVQLRDRYNVRTGIHSVVAHQIFEKNSGVGVYTVKSLTKT